jgi:2-polyprenyl-3-methyl-5-hydroxy-6-metoxy-1,4-benzoquinol methylase
MNVDMYRIFFEIQKKHWWFVTKKKIVLDLIDRYVAKNSYMKLLDIGCGSGLMLNALNGLGETYGMDMSDEAIVFSKKIFSGVVKKGVLPNEIPYPEHFFQLITALDVIEHVDEDFETLKVFYSLLVQGGQAVITVPAYMFLWSNFDVVNEHKRRYTLSELNTKLLNAGFTIQKISYYNSLLFPIVLVVRVLNNLLKRDGTSDVNLPSLPINFILRSIFIIELFLLRFLNLPFGVSLLAVVKK